MYESQDLVLKAPTEVEAINNDGMILKLRYMQCKTDMHVNI